MTINDIMYVHAHKRYGILVGVANHAAVTKINSGAFFQLITKYIPLKITSHAVLSCIKDRVY